MSMPVVVAIPVKRHVRQFLVKEFGREPIKLHQSTWIGKLSFPFLEKKEYRIGAPKPAKLSECNILLLLPKSLKHLKMTDDNRRLLAEVLEKFMAQQLFAFIKALSAAGISEWSAIRMFRDHYDIDADSCDIENMRKWWRDHKAAIEKATDAMHAESENLNVA